MGAGDIALLAAQALETLCGNPRNEDVTNRIKESPVKHTLIWLTSPLPRERQFLHIVMGIAIGGLITVTVEAVAGFICCSVLVKLGEVMVRERRRFSITQVVLNGILNLRLLLHLFIV